MPVETQEREHDEDFDMLDVVADDLLAAIKGGDKGAFKAALSALCTYVQDLVQDLDQDQAMKEPV